MPAKDPNYMKKYRERNPEYQKKWYRANYQKIKIKKLIEKEEEIEFSNPKATIFSAGELGEGEGKTRDFSYSEGEMV